jgi:Uma2 family endonuclease
MSDPYEEILNGELTLRLPPGARHEWILERLRAALQTCLRDAPAARLLEPRAPVRVAHATCLRPDLALVTAANDRLWLAVEVVSADDHRTDTVTKKQIYEEIKVSRLWMVDPRYDNVEVYHATEYGLKLVGILAGREMLEERLLPGLRLPVQELFTPPPQSPGPAGAARVRAA